MFKDEFIQVRVSAKIKNEVEERAKELGLSISDYVRYLVQKDLEENKK